MAAELLVAVLILASTLIASIGVVCNLLRQSRESHLVETATAIASSRVERMELEGCASADGRERLGDFTSAWSVTRAGGLVLVTDSVTFRSPVGLRHVTIRRVLLCE
jgi:Tfp pilus assembly protein PilV